MDRQMDGSKLKLHSFLCALFDIGLLTRTCGSRHVAEEKVLLRARLALDELLVEGSQGLVHGELDRHVWHVLHHRR